MRSIYRQVIPLKFRLWFRDMRRSKAQRYFIRKGYQAREQPEHFIHNPPMKMTVVYRPTLYGYAAYLARHFGCTHIVCIGCAQFSELIKLHPEFQIVGIDNAEIIGYCVEKFPDGTWQAWHFDHLLSLDSELLRHSIVICSDVIERLGNPTTFLKSLKAISEVSPVVLLSTLDRERVVGKAQLGPPLVPYHAREWTHHEMNQLLAHYAIPVAFSGYLLNNSRDRQRNLVLHILYKQRFVRAPEQFRVVALMPTYNEADVIVPVLQHLIANGIEVYLLDNWSSDNTVDLVEPFLGKGVIGIERFPSKNLSKYNAIDMMTRLEELGQTLEADWFIYHDADEIREAADRTMRLKDAIYQADYSGFNCINHIYVQFVPMDHGFDGDLSHFRYWEIGTRPGFYRRANTWKKTEHRVSLAKTLGHDVQFPNKRVYPFRFLIKHYVVRSQAHAEQKIFRERKPRYLVEERQKKFHTHYDHIEAGYNFIAHPADVMVFDDSFYTDYLVERLSSVGFNDNYRGVQS